MDYFDASAAQYRATAVGNPVRINTGFEGTPLGSFAGQMAAPHLQSPMNRMGMTPFGVGTGNPYDVMRQNDFYRQAVIVANEGAARDAQRFVRTTEGAFNVVGAQFGAPQRQAAEAMAKSLSANLGMMTPMMADQMDQLAGFQGSSTVMGWRMAQGGRSRVDAVTGRLGMSSQSTDYARKTIDRHVYDGGRMYEFGGLSAGQMGSMYDELSRRGLMAGTTGAEIRQTSRHIASELEAKNPALLKDAMAKTGVKAGTKAEDLTNDDIERLKLDPRIADRLRSFDAAKTVTTLKEYSKAVGAMKDIFGANGEPDAPMSKIMASLEAMTGGNLGKMDPGKVSQLVRQTHNLAQNNGIDMNTMMMMNQTGMVNATNMGVENIFGIMGVQQAVATRSALQGVRNGVTELSGEQLTEVQGKRTAAVAASKGGNRLGALRRIAKISGGFEEGSTLDAMMAAIDAEETEFVDPKTGKSRSVHMSDDEFAQQVSKTKGRGGKSLGLSVRGVREMLGQTKANREFIEDGDLAVGSKLQIERDIKRPATQQMQASLQAALKDAGVDAAVAKQASGKASQNLFDQLRSLPVTLSPEARRKAFGEILGKELKQTQAAGAITNMNLDLVGDNIMGTASEYLEKSGKGSLATNTALGNKAVMEQGGANRMQARVQGALQDALSPLRSESLLRNLSGALQGADAKDPDALARAMAKTMGGLDDAAINKALEDPLKKVGGAYAELSGLEKQFAGEKDPAKRRELMRGLEAKKKAIRDEVGNLEATMATNKIFFMDSLTAAKIDPKDKAKQKEAAGLFGTKITSDDDAKAILKMRGMEATKENVDEMKKGGIVKSMDEAFGLHGARAEKAKAAKEAKEGGTGGGRGGPTTITGTLRIEGSRGDLNATAGQGIDHLGA